MKDEEDGGRTRGKGRSKRYSLSEYDTERIAESSFSLRRRETRRSFFPSVLLSLSVSSTYVREGNTNTMGDNRAQQEAKIEWTKKESESRQMTQREQETKQQLEAPIVASPGN